MKGQRMAAVAPLCSGEIPSNALPVSRRVRSWSVTQRGRIVEVGYGSESDFPQYAAVHLDSGFLRLNYGPDSAWGTSIILLPSFWVAGRYYQGEQITATWRTEDTDLVISFKGSICTLQVRGKIRLAPPASNLISGSVTANVDGDVDVDCRPGETFKPVTLSSMHISADQWDAQLAQIDKQSFRIPTDGWINHPPVVGHRFALKAGSSVRKTNSPTIEIELDECREIAGWKTEGFSPDDDNLSLWAATKRVVRVWQYAFAAKP